MFDPHSVKISGIRWSYGRLWLSLCDEPIIATYDPDTGQCDIKLRLPNEVTSVCPTPEGLWLIARGGKLGRRLVLWSLQGNCKIREFDCPDGAAAGMAIDGVNLWLTHRRNRKLFCMDCRDGKMRWLIRTDKESFSPDIHEGNLWMIESDPGPLGHWSAAGQARFFFIRYDTVRETVVERIHAPLTPTCMSYDGKRFWYAPEGQKGFRWVAQDSLPRATAG